MWYISICWSQMKNKNKNEVHQWGCFQYPSTNMFIQGYTSTGRQFSRSNIILCDGAYYLWALSVEGGLRYRSG
jgi:hypothetical protein